MEKRKHKVVIWLKAEVSEVLSDGNISGVPVHNTSKLIAIEGEDRFIAIRKLNELVEKIQQWTKQ